MWVDPQVMLALFLPPILYASTVWTSTRSVVDLLLALSLPGRLPDGRPFAERELVLVVAALVIVGSVLAQGLTLRHVVRRAALSDPDDEAREERLADRAMAEAHAAVGTGPEANGFDAERRALFALRVEDRIGDDVLRRMLRETDLRSRAAEHSAPPGAGPPNPRPRATSSAPILVNAEEPVIPARQAAWMSAASSSGNPSAAICTAWPKGRTGS